MHTILTGIMFNKQTNQILFFTNNELELTTCSVIYTSKLGKEATRENNKSVKQLNISVGFTGRILSKTG